MADSLSSFEEDENSLDGQYGNGKQPLEFGSGFQSPRFARPESRPKRRSSVRQTLETEDLLNLLHGSDPVRVELTRLENEVRDKERELGEASTEIKALRLSERLREKAVEELSDELERVDERCKATTLLLENKNLEVKRLNDEKKAAQAAQYAAEATLRRVHAAQKDEDLPPIEAILAPLEAELKLARHEVAKLQENNRALDRLTKTKEAALLEAERTVQIAEAKASMVDDLQNRNQELLKQIEICQEENRILDKMHRQKVAEVEKLSATVHDLEEAVLAGGAAVNAARDYQRQVHELLEGKRTLERELARAKISANRVATVVANDFKDGNDKVMPVKQWLEERRFMQGEMQQLRDKLASAERTSKNESQLKEKLQLRLKVLEEGLRMSGNGTVRGPTEEAMRSASVTTNGSLRQPSGTEEGGRVLANGSRTKRSAVAQLRASMGSSTLLKNGRMTSKSFDGGRSSDVGTSNRMKPFTNGYEELRSGRRSTSEAAKSSGIGSPRTSEPSEAAREKVGSATPAVEGGSDTVSGVLYDMLQKEVITLRKASHEKNQGLKDKDDAIEMLSKKVDTLSKAMEVEAKKMRREVIVMEKEVAAMKVDKDQDRRTRRPSMSKEPVHSSSQRMTGRSVRRDQDI